MAKFRWTKDDGANWTVVEASLPYNISGVIASDTVIVEPIGDAVTDVVFDPIQALFSSGIDGAWFTADAERLFTSYTGVTQTTVGGYVGLALDCAAWNGKTFAQYLASATELWGWQAPSITDFGGCVGYFTAPDTSGNNITGTDQGYPRFGYNLGLVGGARYRVSGMYTESVDSLIWNVRLAKSGSVNALQAGSGTIFGTPRNAGGNTTMELQMNGTRAAPNSLRIDSLSCKVITGNHGEQQTAGRLPTLQSSTVLRFDGVDDNLLTILKPSTSNTIFVLGTLNSAARCVVGSQTGIGDRCWIGTDASGRLAAGVGDQDATMIFGGADIRGARGVYSLLHDGSTVKLHVGQTEVYSGAQSGAANTTVPVMIGSLNNNGTYANSMSADITQCIIFKQALTDGQRASVASQLMALI